MKILEIITEPNKIYTENKFKIKIKVTGIVKTYKYMDYKNEKFTDYNEEKYSSIRKWDEI